MTPGLSFWLFISEAVFKAIRTIPGCTEWVGFIEACLAAHGEKKSLQAFRKEEEEELSIYHHSCVLS